MAVFVSDGENEVDLVDAEAQDGGVIGCLDVLRLLAGGRRLRCARCLRRSLHRRRRRWLRRGRRGLLRLLGENGESHSKDQAKELVPHITFHFTNGSPRRPPPLVTEVLTGSVRPASSRRARNVESSGGRGASSWRGLPVTGCTN